MSHPRLAPTAAPSPMLANPTRANSQPENRKERVAGTYLSWSCQPSVSGNSTPSHEAERFHLSRQDASISNTLVPETEQCDRANATDADVVVSTMVPDPCSSGGALGVQLSSSAVVAQAHHVNGFVEAKEVGEEKVATPATRPPQRPTINLQLFKPIFNHSSFAVGEQSSKHCHSVQNGPLHCYASTASVATSSLQFSSGASAGGLRVDGGTLDATKKSRSLTNLERTTESPTQYSCATSAATASRICVSPTLYSHSWKHPSSSIRNGGRPSTTLNGLISSRGPPTAINGGCAGKPNLPQVTLRAAVTTAAGLKIELKNPSAEGASYISTAQNSGLVTVSGDGNETSQIRITPGQAHSANSPDIRLQQSLSTPCPGGSPGGTKGPDDMIGPGRKDTEYRRFRSEGSTATMPNTLPAHEIDTAANGIDDLSPISDHRSSPPHRLNLLQPQDTIVNGSLAKPHPHTEQVLMVTLKTKLQKYQGFIDKAFELVQKGADEHIFEGCTIVTKVLTKSWLYPKISNDLAYALCDYLREQGYFDIIINLFVKQGITDSIRVCCGRVLEECISLNNRDYIVVKGYLKRVVNTAEKLNKTPEQQRMSLSIMESLFKHSTSTTSKLIEFGVLDHILLTCKMATDLPATLRHAALALANLCLFSCPEATRKIIQKKLPDWLFLLASQEDEITRYYACLAICILGSSISSSKEMEAAVNKSGTLALVEPFLVAHPSPVVFAAQDYRHSQGRSKEWLIREAKSMASFHFAMESAIRKENGKLPELQEIGVVSSLKEVASSPDEQAAKFASEALTMIGEELPHKLSQQVPSWTVNDVCYWIAKIGFGTYAERFTANMVDGDLLLLLSEKELEEDLGMKSSILRKRFMRELESLKIAADYSNVDESQLDSFLMSLGPELSVYTYQMLGMGINRSLLPHLTNDMMKGVCGMSNPMHRLKLRQALQDSKHIDDIEVALLSKQIDIFISYRRSTGNQLASLIKVLLQLRGYKVFIDVDKLYAGKFDSSLLKNIQAAKHFILVLTPNSLDRLLNDHNCEDWIHKELQCAFANGKNVIPIFDQTFEFPPNVEMIPDDIRQITKYNGVRWVHDYQEACIDKVERFIKGELNRMPSLGANSASVRHSNQPSSRKAAYKLASSNMNQPPTGHSGRLSAASSQATVASRTRLAHQPSQQGHQPGEASPTNLSAPSNALRSMEKQGRRKLFASVSTVYSEK